MSTNYMGGMCKKCNEGTITELLKHTSAVYDCSDYKQHPNCRYSDFLSIGQFAQKLGISRQKVDKDLKRPIVFKFLHAQKVGKMVIIPKDAKDYRQKKFMKKGFKSK